MSKKIPLHTLAKIRSAPWAIQKEALREIVQVARRELSRPHDVRALADTMALSDSMAQARDDTPWLKRRGNVGIVSVEGPIFRYASWFDELCGATSYERIADAVGQVARDPNLSALMLSIDSPGGEVNGCSDCADMIYGLRDSLDVVAMVHGDACSAAYWIASSASHIVLSPTSLLGSIGVVGLYTDDSKAMEKAGIEEIEIVSSQSPDKRPDPADDEGRAQIQAMVDSLADVFISAVARNRNVSVDSVLSDFGQGGVFVGREGIGAGLGDEIGTYDEVVAALNARP